MSALMKFKSKNAPDLRVINSQQAPPPAQARQVGYKNDPASATLTGTPLHGPFMGDNAQFGPFSGMGVRPDRYSALIRPMSLARLLVTGGALQRTDFFQELLEINTGQTVGAGSNPTDFCGDPATAGQLKVMRRNFLFGDWTMKTKLNAVPNIGLLRNRADIPGRILNSGMKDNPLIPEELYRLDDTRSQLQNELFTLGVELERSLEQVLILGNSALSNSNTHRGFIKEFDGLDLQIKTGYTDSVSGSPAPVADSIVENYANIVSGTQTATGRTIVQVISDIFYALLNRATRVGMDGYDMGIVMRQEMFRALTDVYACTYATARCVNSNAGQPQAVDQTYINELRLEMLNGQYLLIEGVRVPVVFSDGMTLTQVAAQQFNTSIYFVPLSWAGQPLIRMEYFAMDNPYATQYANFVGGDRYTIMNNGLYMVGYRSTGLCDEYHFAAKMRVILETPFLAARIDNIQFNYYAQTHSPYPGETYSYANGGVTYRL